MTAHMWSPDDPCPCGRSDCPATPPDVTARLSDAERATLLNPCKCGHTINDHGTYAGCWACADDASECPVTFEALLVERQERIIAARLAAAEVEWDALRATVERVEALADEWRYKGEFGWGAWQEGHGPDFEGAVYDDAAARLRAALTGDDGGESHRGETPQAAPERRAGSGWHSGTPATGEAVRSAHSDSGDA